MSSEQDILGTLIEITSNFYDERSVEEDEKATFSASTAISQDAMIFGIDVEDYVSELEEEFGKIVWDIPWGLYTDQTFSFRGFGILLLPLHLLWRLIRWPFVRGDLIPTPDPRNFPKRLELGDIAKVLETGRWIEPEK